MPLHFIAVQIGSLNVRDVCRCRHKLKNCIQQLLYPFVSVRGTTAYRNCRTLTGPLAERCLHIFYRRFFPFQINHHQLIVQLADFLYQLGVIQFRIIFHIFRNIGDGNIVALIVIIDIGFHFKQVDNALEIIFFSDRELKNNGILTQSCLNLIYCAVEIRTQNVHLIDKRYSRYIVRIGLAPYIL